MAPKIAAISSMVRLIGWIRPAGRGRGGRVGSMRSCARRASRSAASSSALRASMALGQRVLQPVQRRAAFPPLVGRGFAEFLQQAGQLAVAAEHGDADGVPGAQVGGLGQGGVGFGFQGLEIVGHVVSSETPKAPPCGRRPLAVRHRRAPSPAMLRLLVVRVIRRRRPARPGVDGRTGSAVTRALTAPPAPSSRSPRRTRRRHRRWRPAPCGPSRCPAFFSPAMNTL